MNYRRVSLRAKGKAKDVMVANPRNAKENSEDPRGNHHLEDASSVKGSIEPRNAPKMP